MAPAAQKVLQAIAALNTGQVSDSGARQGDLAGDVGTVLPKRAAAVNRQARILNQP